METIRQHHVFDNPRVHSSTDIGIFKPMNKACKKIGNKIGGHQCGEYFHNTILLSIFFIYFLRSDYLITNSHSGFRVELAVSQPALPQIWT